MRRRKNALRWRGMERRGGEEEEGEDKLVEE